jgi:hypothetical protein
MIMDPISPATLFIGMDSLYRTTNGMASWVNLGSPLTGGSFTEMEQGINDRQRLYASSGITIYKTTQALQPTGPVTWTNITAGLPGLWITGIAVNPENANEVYVSLGDFSSGNKVFFSNNGGNPGSWVNITGTLPNVTTGCIELHDNGLNNRAIYLGTDIGVFYRDNDMSDWLYFSNGMPNVLVNDLYINHGANLITAGTYGRGLWISATYGGCDNTLTLTPPAGALPSGTKYYSTETWITSSTEYSPSLGTDINYSSGNFIDMIPGFRAGGPGLFRAKIGPCPTLGLSEIAELDPGGLFAMRREDYQSLLKKEK